MPRETEVLAEKEQFNELLMIGLRTTWGVDLSAMRAQFSSELLEYFYHEIKSKLEDGLLVIENDHLVIPEKHWFLADGIAADLFLVGS